MTYEHTIYIYASLYRSYMEYIPSCRYATSALAAVSDGTEHPRQTSLINIVAVNQLSYYGGPTVSMNGYVYI